MTFGVENVLQEATNASSPGQQARKQWEQKSPEEQVYAGRKVLHGALAPILRAAANGDSLPVQQIDMADVEKIEGLFETIFERYTQNSGSQSGRRMSGSSS